MSPRLLALVPLLAFPLLTLPSVAAVPAEFAGRGCTFWNDENGNGPNVKLDVRSTDNNGQSYYFIQNTMHPSRDNTVSALACDYHCNASLYDQPNRGGGEIFVLASMSGFTTLRGHPANNRASSISVFCAR